MNTATKPPRPKMPRVFVDMDGVAVDFDGYRDRLGLTSEEVKVRKGAYLDMELIPGALEALQVLIGLGFDVWLATKPPTGIAHAYSDKAAFVFKQLPFLRRKVIITHHKGLLGSEDDYLVDDRPHKASCTEFAGTLVPFVDGYHWPQALEFFRAEAARLKGRTGQTISIIDAKRGEIARRLQERNRHIDIVTARFFVDATLDLVEGIGAGGALQAQETLPRLEAALDRYQSMASHVGGCTDGGCLILRPTGMHTNGGCKCPQDKIKAARLLQAGQQLAGIVAKCVSVEAEQAISGNPLPS